MEQLGHRHKLERARKHFRALTYQFNRWRQRSDAYRFIYEPGGGLALLYLGAPDPPPEWGLLIGDYLHNVRSSLDHLAYELAVAHSGDLTPPQESGSEFPIFGARPMTSGEARRRIGCVAPDAQSLILGLQPANLGTSFGSDPLWLLHELSNGDKHRLFLVAVTGRGDMRFPSKHFRLLAPGEPGYLEPDEAVAASLTMVGDGPKQVTVGLSMKVLFKNGFAEGRDVFECLSEIQSHVEDRVVAPLERFL